jgi:16S rRNA (guanine527-N7)-methyltransferase
MFHVKHEAWGRALEAFGLGDRAAEALAAYHDLLLELAVPRGWIAASDRDRLWERHILDGLRGVPELSPEGRVVDLGSGAGIPGVPLAIARPEAAFTLTEPRRSRAAFLEAVVDRLRLQNVDVWLGKAEAVTTRFQAATARAFAAASSTWEAAESLLEPAGTLVYWAGAGFDPSEIAGLGVRWRVSTPSDLADPGALVIMSRQ